MMVPQVRLRGRGSIAARHERSEYRCNARKFWRLPRTPPLQPHVQDDAGDIPRVHPAGQGLGQSQSGPHSATPSMYRAAPRFPVATRQKRALRDGLRQRRSFAARTQPVRHPIEPCECVFALSWLRSPPAESIAMPRVAVSADRLNQLFGRELLEAHAHVFGDLVVIDTSEAGGQLCSELMNTCVASHLFPENRGRRVQNNCVSGFPVIQHYAVANVRLLNGRRAAKNRCSYVELHLDQPSGVKVPSGAPAYATSRARSSGFITDSIRGGTYCGAAGKGAGREVCVSCMCVSCGVGSSGECERVIRTRLARNNPLFARRTSTSDNGSDGGPDRVVWRSRVLDLSGKVLRFHYRFDSRRIVLRC